MAGGVEAMLAHARQAVEDGDFQWAAELADYVLAADAANGAARRIKADALAELGERQVNATARNYYLTSARFLRRIQALSERPQTAVGAGHPEGADG